MLHRDMIVHVREAFDGIFKNKQIIGVDQIPEEWLLSIRDEQPRWVGPEIAAALRTHVSKHRSPQDASERIARLYAEMLRGNWGRGPYVPSVVKDLTRTVHMAVVTLAEPERERKADWYGAKIACALIHAFRKILYPVDTPANISDSVWRFLSTCTLPMRNQSSRITKHEDTWCDLLVRFALVQMAKVAHVNWNGASKAREFHPELGATMVAQVHAAERAGVCSEEESDNMREALGMGTRPEGEIGADFECLAGVDLDAFLLDAGDQASEVGSVFEGSLRLVSPITAPVVSKVTPEKPKAAPRPRGRPAGSTKKRSNAQFVTAWAAEPEPYPKTRRLVSSLDMRKDWRRNDGTLYTYFRVIGNSFMRVADKLSHPTLRIIKEEDLLCTDEKPLDWTDGPLPHEEARVFMPLSTTA